MKRINEIAPTDKSAAADAQRHWDSIAKPLGSMGDFESLLNKIAAIQGTHNIDISKRAVVVMCADNGVVCEGVTQTGSEVTAISSAAIACGKSNINALAEEYGAEVLAVDIGIKGYVECSDLINRKISNGTHNIAAGPAMTVEEAERAICIGIDIIRDLKKQGIKIAVTGEMGIGNTTTASALSSVLLGLPPEEVTGRGAGLTADGLRRKIAVVKKAIEVNKPDAEKPVELLAKLGGLDIAGMTGLFLGGAIYHIPIIIDGLISAVAAAIAFKINPLSAEYMLAGHVSAEPAGRGLLEMMKLHAPIDAGLRLGEGTGGIMLLPLLDGAAALYSKSHRFDESGIERYVELK